MNIYDAISYLEKEGKTIGRTAPNNPLAQKIIDAYNLFWNATGDPGGQALLIIAIEEYQKQQGENISG